MLNLVIQSGLIHCSLRFFCNLELANLELQLKNTVLLIKEIDYLIVLLKSVTMLLKGVRIKDKMWISKVQKNQI